MIKKKFKSLAAFFLTLIMIIGLVPLQAHATVSGWQTLGAADFSDDKITNNLSMCIDNATPYVAYADRAYGSKATVMKYTADGGWVPVGQKGFSDGATNGISMCFYGNKPYVAYQDNYTSDYKGTVMTYSEGSWSAVGTSRFTSGMVMSPKICAGSDGTFYFGYVGTGSKIIVMKYTGESWSQLGPDVTSSSYSGGFTMYVDGDTPYVAYYDSTSSSKVVVKSYNGSNWVTLGDYASAGGAGSMQLFVDNGTPYVAYQDAANSNKATVMAYTNSSWSSVGIIGFTSTTASNISLFVENGTPYIAYTDPGAFTPAANVMKYDGDSWEIVGNPGFTPGRAQLLSLLVDDGVPYLAFQDCVHDYKATVMKYESGIVYPQYVITKQTVSDTEVYHVYKKASASASFTAFAGDDEHGYGHQGMATLMSAVRSDVGSGSATLIFGATGTTDKNVSGVLDIGTDFVDLGASGTYTIKGSVTGSNDYTLLLDGASIIIDGASIQNIGEYYTIKNDGSGSITVSSGTVEKTGDGNAIYNYGDGSVTVSGGTVESKDDDAIQNRKSGEITVSGGTVKTTGDCGTINCNGTNHITVSGGTIESTGETNTIICAITTGEGGITVSGGRIYCKNGAAIDSPEGDVEISGTAWNEANSTGTLVQSDGMCCISSSGPVTVKGGTISSKNTGVYSSGETIINDGLIEAGNGAALCVDGTTCRISGGTLTSANTTEASVDSLESDTYPGTIWVSDYGDGNAMLNISGGSITNTATGYPAIFNIIDDSSYKSDVFLSGTPSISGDADIWTYTAICANDGNETPTYYSGNPLSVFFGGEIEGKTTVAVNGASDSNYSKFGLTNEGYKLTRSGSNLLISSGTSENSGRDYDYTPSRTITVSETSSDLFSGSTGQIKAEANMDNAFSNSVEVKVTDTAKNDSGFGLGAGNAVYPFDISLYIKGTNTKTEPKDGYAVTISLPVPDKLLEVKDQLTIAHKSDSGTVTTLKSQLKQINGAWYLVFEATEFSPYALVVSSTGTYDETAGLPYYLDSAGKEVFIGFAANGKYIAPSGVTALFKKNPKTFTDTSAHWAKDYIGFVTERELFNGIGDNRFSPDTGMTRVMFAAVIGRLYERSYGEIKALSGHAFTDCDYSGYYGKYVDWAAEKGIIGGYGNGKFGPDDQITREQMAAIMYRFADFLGVVPSNMGISLNYHDAGAVSSWAKNAALYCQTAGIITGRDGGSFAPHGTATRGEVATIIQRFIKTTVD